MCTGLVWWSSSPRSQIVTRLNATIRTEGRNTYDDMWFLKVSHALTPCNAPPTRHNTAHNHTIRSKTARARVHASSTSLARLLVVVGRVDARAPRADVRHVLVDRRLPQVAARGRRYFLVGKTPNPYGPRHLYLVLVDRRLPQVVVGSVSSSERRPSPVLLFVHRRRTGAYVYLGER